MITKFRTLLVGAMLIGSLPFISTANNGQKKETLCHNGHEITIAEPAVEHHLKNHNKPGAKLTCYRGPCQDTPPTNPCNTCPTPTPKPPKCNGCQ